MKKARFDVEGLYRELDMERRERRMSWRGVATTAGISASTLSRIAQGKRPDVDSLAALLSWAGLSCNGSVCARAVAPRTDVSRPTSGEIADKSKVLFVLVGLPRSGKTTRALQLGYPIVCPDAIRLALHGRRYEPLAEPFVWAQAKLMVRALYEAGHDRVTLDACNVSRKRREEWLSDAWKVVIHLIATDAKTCSERAIQTGRQELLPIIQRMRDNWEPVANEEPEE